MATRTAQHTNASVITLSFNIHSLFLDKKLLILFNNIDLFIGGPFWPSLCQKPEEVEILINAHLLLYFILKHDFSGLLILNNSL